MRFLWYSLAGALVLGGAVLSATDRVAQALPAAGTEVLPVVVTVDAVSLLGAASVVLIGWMQVDRAPPRLEGDVEVLDLEIVGLELRGASQIGLVVVAERPNDGPDYASSGELRSLQPGQDFPASSFFDLFIDVDVPASPIGALLLHNEVPLHLTPQENGQEVPLSVWPPLGVSYELEPIFAVDNDGDGDIDEDTADDDGDGLIDEDQPGPDPDTPGTGGPCGDDADCDGSEGEDPPIELCPPALCDNDGDGRIDEDPACIPLFNQGNTHMKAGFCVRNLTLEIAPELPSYSVARGGLSALHPADILALTPNGASSASQPPFVRVPCANLGLSVDGCDDGADGDQDDLDALSYGDDLPGGGGQLYFSVGPGAQGVAGSAVEGQRNCPPAQPGLSPEPEPDEFGSVLDGTNHHVLDGNGPVGACSPAFPLGLIEAATVRDDLDALYDQDSSLVDEDADGVPESPVYFSLDAASPSLDTAGFSAADVLKTVAGSAPVAYVPAAVLGLQAEDDLDALCLRESGDGLYGGDDVLYFSLAPGSPTLSQIGAGPGDVLAPGNPPAVAQSALSLGLLAADDVNALKCRALRGFSGGNGDVNCDSVTNSIDAALVLQYDAGLIDALACAQSADANEDGATNSIDAALILQFDAGLIGRLPLSWGSAGRSVGMQKLLGRRL